MSIKPQITFNVIFNDCLTKIDTTNELKPNANKHVLSIVNDFEDKAWRYEKFRNFVWDNLAETSLSARERASLINQHHSILVQAAKNLRLIDEAKDDAGKGSELAEIVLYGIMKEHFKALPVVPKIFYKQNTSDYAKGADSVHIVIENSTDFSIWFGEAKFYDSIENARLAKIIESVQNTLSTEKLKKENSIITNLSDIHDIEIDEAVKTKILQTLAHQESIDDLKSKLHVPILLLYECAITKENQVFSAEYKKSIVDTHSERAKVFFKKQIETIASQITFYESINFHLILFPVPDKELIVNTFIKNLKHYRGQ